MSSMGVQRNGLDASWDAFADIDKELSADGLFRLAVWFQSNNDLEKAARYYALALAGNHGLPEASYNLGLIHFEQQNWKEAIFHFNQSLKHKPDFADAALYLAAALKENGQLKQAAMMYGRVAELKPHASLARYCQALCLHETGQYTKAIHFFIKAIALEPENAQYWFYLGNSVRKTQKMDQTVACFFKAVKYKPDWDSAHYNLSSGLHLIGRLSEAIAHAFRALQLSPDLGKAQALLFKLLQHACDWHLLSIIEPQLELTIKKELAGNLDISESPMVNLRRQADPCSNLAVAAAWSRKLSRDAEKAAVRPVFHYASGHSPKLRIGYLSNDFKDHAVAHQIRGVLAAHDKEEFDIIGYAANAENNTQYRRLLFEACDQIRNIHGLSPVAAARQIHADGIHILVEMSGYSAESLLPIAALRPAPIQVSYLGFLGSTGADFIDYVLADAVVVPPEHKPYYSEKVVYLPHCYQANDDEQIISTRTYQRHHFELPAKGFVFCCFNQPYKISEQVFNIWMNILKKVDHSVLWLLKRWPLTQTNLKNAARKAGVDPSRLVFAGFMPLSENLSRLRLADLALDTFTYNGGATTSNALWAGLPVLTLMGNHWLSRMSASALHAIGMPELITCDMDAYEKTAVELAQNPMALDGLRSKLDQQRSKAPLFDTRLFTKHLESAYKTMWQRHEKGQRPISFSVMPSAPDHATEKRTGVHSELGKLDRGQGVVNILPQA